MERNCAIPMSEYVYFIQAQSGGPIKIGKAKDVAKRVMILQCGNPDLLVVRRTIPFADAEAAERRLHRAFTALRIQGEWFKAHPALAAVADAIPDPALADEPFDYAAVAAPYNESGITFWDRDDFPTREQYDAAGEQWTAERARMSTDLDRVDSWDVSPSITAIPEGIE